MNDIAVVIPAFNEGATIRDVASRARAHCGSVIVVDDGSAEPLAKVLDGLDITLLRHDENQGKAAAICSGAQLAVANNCDLIITMDGDGQHRPEDIPLFVSAASNYPDAIIIGARTGVLRRSVSRRRANKVADFWISWAAGYPIQDSQSGFRLYPRAVFEELEIQTSKRRGFVFESEVLIEAAEKGIRSNTVEIPDIYSESMRPSHFKPVSDITGITLMIASRLVRRGLYLPGLYRSHIQPGLQKAAPPGLDRDALIALMLSLLFMLATIGLFYAWILYRVHRTATTMPVDAQGADAAIVLGHQLNNGELSAEFTARLFRASLLSKASPAMDFFITGGLSSAGTTEADAGYAYLVRAGVNAERIHREDASTHTVENLAHIQPVLGRYATVALVTNRYHLERSLTVATGMGMSLKACGAEDNYSITQNFWRATVEAFYIHWYWAGRIFGKITRNDRILGKLGIV